MRKVSVLETAKLPTIKLLLKSCYAKDRRKVPESWKKNDLPAPVLYFVLVLVLLLTGFLGHRDGERPSWRLEFRGNHSVYPTRIWLQLRRAYGTDKLLARPETDSMIQPRPGTRKIEEQKIGRQQID